MMISQQEETAKSFTFLAPNGVTQMGKKTRLIRIREDEWDDVEPFLRKPTFITLKEVQYPE
jgi:hypothetical protein